MIYSIQKNPAPNVVVGMQFDKERFKELFNWINAVQMDSVALLMPTNSYGLLYVDPIQANFRLEIMEKEVQLFRCFALTENGSLIAISSENEPVLKVDTLSFPDDIYEILITVDTNNRKAVGREDESEIPKRQPFSIPKYELTISPKGEKRLDAFSSTLKIGELILSGSMVQLNDTYVPSCFHAGAHPKMLAKAKIYQQQMGKLLKSFTEVCRITHLKQDTEKANLYNMSKVGGQFLAKSMIKFDEGHKLRPSTLFELCKSLANILQFEFQTINRQTELVHLIQKNVAHTSGIRFPLNGFREDVAAMADAKFMPLNLLENFEVMDRFFSTILTNGFEVLSKNTVIVVGGLEQPFPNIPSAKKNVSSTKSSGFI